MLDCHFDSNTNTTSYRCHTAPWSHCWGGWGGGGLLPAPDLLCDAVSWSSLHKARFVLTRALPVPTHTQRPPNGCYGAMWVLCDHACRGHAMGCAVVASFKHTLHVIINLKHLLTSPGISFPVHTPAHTVPPCAHLLFPTRHSCRQRGVRTVGRLLCI